MLDNDDGNSNEEDSKTGNNDNEYVPSVGSKKSTAQSLLTIQEDELFKETFYNLIHSSKPIVMEHVIDIIKKKPKLQHLTKKFTNRQLADKVRTIRKAVARENEKKKIKRTRKTRR